MTAATPLGAFNTQQISRYTTLPPAHISWYRDRKAALDPGWDSKRNPLDIRDLIELRLYNFVYRHHHILKSEVREAFDLTAQTLQTPYPFSHPDFMANTQEMMRSTQHQPDFEVDQQRLDHIVSCIDRSPNDAPTRWRISRDLALPAPADRIVIDPDLHPSDPVMDGTRLSIFDVAQHADSHEHNPEQRFGITKAQLRSCLCVATTLDLAKRIRAISDLTHIMPDEDEPEELEYLRRNLTTIKHRMATRA